MIGNKYAADELARNFLAGLSKNRVAKEKNYEKIKKEAQDVSKKDTVEHSAEDYLLDESEASDEQYASAIDKEIKSLSDDGKKCNMCGYAHDASYACDMKSYAKDVPSSESFDRNSYHAMDQHAKSSKAAKQNKSSSKNATAALSNYIDKKSSYVASELSKIASDLRASGNGFAADMVEVTNNDIKKAAFVKASGKAYIVSELLKMAQESLAEGDRMTADVIHATVLNIKNGEE